MKYLNDEIFVPVSLSSAYENSYHLYEVWVTQEYRGAIPQKIYTGRIFYSPVHGHINIYLNDLLENEYNCSQAFASIYESGIDIIGPGYNLLNSHGVIFRVKIIFPEILINSSPLQITYNEPIFNGYPRIDSNTYSLDHLTSPTEKTLYTGWELTGDVSPRIPNLPYYSKNLFFGVNFLVSDGLNPDTFQLVEDQGRILQEWPNNGADNISYFFKDKFNFSEKSRILYIQSYRSGLSKVAARIDQCPADYYCVWVDRLGSTQCQPFSQKSTLSESIQTTKVTDYRNRTKPYIRSVTYQWDLNTNWVDEKTYNTYESLLVSPYIYLYDVKKDLGYWVNCLESSWIEKTNKNQNRLFNFNIKLTLNKNQNILS